MKISRALWTFVAVAVAACTPEASFEPQVGESSFAAAPAGSDADFVEAVNFPPVMNPGERLNLRVRMQNTGASSPANDWDASYALFRVVPTAFTVNDFVTLPAVRAQPFAEIEDFDFAVTAPTTPGQHTFQARMYHQTNVNPGYFGDLVSVTFTVDPNQQRRWDCALASSTIPSSMFPGERRSVTLTVRNSGYGTWQGQSMFLVSRDDPQNFWGAPVNIPVSGPVAPNGTVTTASFSITAPTTPGTYTFRRQMADFNAVSPAGGVGLFDSSAFCVDLAIDVTGREIDLATQNADRTIYGEQQARRLGTVAIGDVTGDGIRDIAVASIQTITPPVGAPRTLAGAVYVYSGGAGFFTGATTRVPTGAFLRVIGARNFDMLGGEISGNVAIGDVTGDGTADLVVSAGGADCAGLTAENCGRVYVIRGGPALASAGTIDLRTDTANVIARYVGQNAGDQARITAIADVTNDGRRDLIMGVPSYDNGALLDAGAIAVYAGGAAVTGTITIGVGTTAFIRGAGAGDLLGYHAAVGDFGSTVAPDLVLSTSRHAPPNGGEDAGGAWAIFGPVTGARDLATGQFNAVWRGAGIRDRLGASVAVANVAGTSRPDVIIGVSGTRENGVRYGSADVWAGPIAGGSVFDLATGATPTVRVRGVDPGDDFGRCVGAGDMNADGVPDLVMGSALAQGANNAFVQAGELQVVFGGATLTDRSLDTEPGSLVLYGAGDTARMCLDPGNLAIGDIDSDGRADLCVGSPQADVANDSLIDPGRVDCIRSTF
jgi:hypothetical protein